MIFSPIVGLIHNVKLDRWHPVYFRESPQPSADPSDRVTRYKSGGHHTEGFPNREEGLVGAHDLAERLKEHSIGEVKLNLERDFPWDGEDVPAMVIFFDKSETPSPLF